jgi:hypothetical protein
MGYGNINIFARNNVTGRSPLEQLEITQQSSLRSGAS